MMNRTIFRPFLLSLIIFFSINSQAFAENFYIKMNVVNDDKTLIFKQITREPLKKKNKDAYHVSLARIDNVNSNNRKELENYLVDALNDALKKEFNLKKRLVIEVKELSADRYLSGGRKYNNSPIVLKAIGPAEQMFRRMNSVIATSLEQYNKDKENKVPKGENKIGKEFIEEYVPHITAANTAYMNNKELKLDRDEVIKELNEKIENANFQIRLDLPKKKK